MYIYSMLKTEINTKLKQRLGVDVKPILEGPPAACIIVRKNSTGGVDSPVAYIIDPGKTVVIAGDNNDNGMEFAEAAADTGVPEENIFFSPLSLKNLVAKLNEILSVSKEELPTINLTPPEKARIDEEEPPVTKEHVNTEGTEDLEGALGWPAQDRVKTIAVVGFRGGVGKSTVAASLAEHYRGNGEVVAIVDLGSPPVIYRHFGFSELSGEARDGFIVLKGKVDIFVPEVPIYDFPGEVLEKVVNELKKEYRRVIIDYPSEPRQNHLEINIDCPIIVVDHDMVLSVKKGVDGVYVYNKAVPEVPPEVVTDILHREPVVIKTDIECCMAALVSGETAYQNSGVVAEGIGNLAAKIG